MFKSRTLFVVGAGASYEAGLPIGTELRAKLADKLNIRFDDWGGKQLSGDRQIADAIKRHAHTADEPARSFSDHVYCLRQIRDAIPFAISIDNFLEAHVGNQGIELCGKLGIAKSILEAERGSHLFYDEEKNNAPDLKKVDGTWYASFFQLLTEGVVRKEVSSIFDNVSFITFNYDRCIEHFLLHALQIYYVLPEENARELMKKLTILHPYGMVGHLRWQGINRAGIPFGGSDESRDNLLEIAKQIKTFTERIEDEAALATIRETVQQAEVVVFLGFAFHPQNMELIRVTEGSTMKHIFATAYGISDSDCAVVGKQITDCVGSNGYQLNLRNDLTCSGLFREFWRSLTAASRGVEP